MLKVHVRDIEKGEVIGRIAAIAVPRKGDTVKLEGVLYGVQNVEWAFAVQPQDNIITVDVIVGAT